MTTDSKLPEQCATLDGFEPLPPASQPEDKRAHITPGTKTRLPNAPTVSVLLPTRGRALTLTESIDSLLQTAKIDIEILLRRDDDDKTRLPRLPAEVKTVTGPRYGYRGLHCYVNELAGIADGDWLLLWNDDALMQTPGWDEIVGSHEGEFKVLNPKTNHQATDVIFPVIPRELFKLLGHWSLNAHNDTWIELVAKATGILEPIPVEILHDRFDLTGRNNDTTYAETRSSADTAAFFGPAMTAARAIDIAKIRRHMNSWT